jgi:arylsulfatase A-like enzyme
MRALADLRAPADIRSGETPIPLKGSGLTQTNFSYANSRCVDDPRRASKLQFRSRLRGKAGVSHGHGPWIPSRYFAIEGIKFPHYYGEQSCTAGRAAFLTGQHGIRTGLTKVGFPGAPMGMSQLDPSIRGLLKNLGYATGQFGKNHVGDRNESLPTVNGFDEFFGNLYHLNAEEEPELPDYPKDPAYLAKFGPRGAVRVRVGEHARLQHLVRRVAHSRHDVGWR